jgi:hypothetical protein
MEWLGENDACDEGLEWFQENFPRGGTRNNILKRLEEARRLEDYSWLLYATLHQCPLPQGWVLPEGLTRLHLGGETLPGGTVLPEWLIWLDLGGGTLPAGTVLPESLWYLDLGGGTLPEGLEIPSGCRVYE